MIEITHGTAVQVSEHVRRITASNAGVMTGPGTNTYLVGKEQVAVIDPGPAEPAHIDGILNACDGKLCWILTTHTHPDHSPAAVALAEATGAQVLGNKLPDNDGFQDDTFSPDKSFLHDECLTCNEFTIRALHTPGHVDNHLCYLVEEDGVLLTGDHIMQGSTVVIIPPHGDMKAYIDSLQLLLDYPLQQLGPGHGYMIEKPIEEIQGLIDHRLGREAKVISSMQGRGEKQLEDWVPLVYDDVDPSLHPIAKFSLWAHLLKLEKEQRARIDNERWCLVE